MRWPSRSTFKFVSRCIFCGSDNKLTNEHVFSNWTHALLGPRPFGSSTSRIAKEYLDKPEDSLMLKFPGQIRDWQVKCVCGGTQQSCNGGWMKDIDDAAIPIMSPMIRGEETRLTTSDQHLIASWAALKVMVAEYDKVNFTAATHHTHRKKLWKSGTPPTKGWGVWIGHYERKTWRAQWVSRPMLNLSAAQHSRRNSISPTYFNQNATTQILGKMLIHVIHAPIPHVIDGWRFTTPKGNPTFGAVYKIWPPQGDASIKWPPRALTDADGHLIANAFYDYCIRVATGGH